MLKPNDSERLAHHFLDTNWENLFWGFTCHSRQNYAGHVSLDAEDEIMLGIYHPEGGCLCEMSIRWHWLRSELVPKLNAFSDAWHLLQTPTFQLVLEQLTRERESLATPDEVSALLIACGFIDQSDKPLDSSAPTKP